MNWPPIETAPKDGTWVIIGKRGWSVFPKAKWGDVDGDVGPFGGWIFRDEFLCIGVDGGFLGWDEDIEDGNMPTHWCPEPSGDET